MKVLSEMQAAVRSLSKILPQGNKTYPGLLSAPADTSMLPTANLNGIVTYDPSEFLITALAGTPLHTLVSALAEQGQYLPFDPLWGERGSTIGGAIAGGVSGPRQLLYGSLRDFVMEVQLIDGLGELVRGGGKVVKNSAGFDLPKLMVGSYGRLGVLTEVTLKVLPAPETYLGLRVECSSFDDAMQCVRALRSEPLPIASLEIGQDAFLDCEFAGLSSALAAVTERAKTLLSGRDTSQGNGKAALDRGAEHGKNLLRVAASPATIADFADDLASDLSESDSFRLSAGGTLVWVWQDSERADESLDQLLQKYGYSAIELSNCREELLALGDLEWRSHARLVQKAMDPEGKFLAF